MGTWGYRIFQNDDACDIRDAYREKIIIGQSDSQAEQSVIAEFAMDQDPCLWIPLSLTQWEVGRLSERTKMCALASIESELKNVDELWKPNMRERRREELLFARQKLSRPMPVKKKLRTPTWAFKCPWQIGNVLQYRVSHSTHSTQFKSEYVMLLISGISTASPDSIPCECISVQLYNWHSAISPSTTASEIISEPPALIPFMTKSGIEKKAHTILPSRDMIRLNEMQVISQSPLNVWDDIFADAGSPMNSSFDDTICRTLACRANL